MRILVIEDNPDLIENLCDFLEGHGHALDLAYDGHTGLGLALSERYDAIVLDLVVPGLDGLAVCRRLRAAGCNTPVLMLTARDTLADKLLGFASGSDDYLVKPFALQELEARLTALVRRAQGGHASARLVVGDLVLEPDSARVSRAGRAIELAPIPLKILEVLMRAAPRVVGRGELERAVWGELPPDSDALRAHLHLLRNAIDKPFAQPLLRTLRGKGYQLRTPGEVPA